MSLRYKRDLEPRLRQTVNVNLYHMTKFSNNLSFIVHDFYLKIVVLRHFFHKNCFGQFLSAYFLFWEILNL